MVYVETYHDYELKKECFKVCEEKGYTKATSVLLTPTTLSTSSINNAVQTFTVEVIGDRGNSTIAFYDNGTLIPFTYNNTVYQKLDWSISDTTKTITLNLNYAIEHNITARYFGNSKCLPSTSQNIPLTIPYPPAFNTTLTLTPSLSGGIYRKDQNVTVNGTLKDKDNTNLASKSIKIYVDEVLVSTTTTNSSGAFSYTNSSLSNGIHTIKAVFEGTVQYFESSASTEIGKGYIVDITPQTYWINGKGSIGVTVTDYYGNPISSCGVSALIATGTTLTATTDSNGKATLTRSTALSNLNADIQVKTSYNDESAPFTPIEIVNYNMGVSVDDEIVTPNMSTRVLISFGSDVPTVKGLKVNLTNASPSVVYLNEYGEAEAYYNGAGNGDVTISATFENTVTKTKTIHDILQYWKAGTSKFKQEYTMLTGNMLSLTNGFKFYKDKDDWTNVTCLFGDGSMVDYNVQLSFRVIDIVDPLRFLFGGWYDDGETPYGTPNRTGTLYVSELVTLKNNDIVTLTLGANSTTLAVNTNTIQSENALPNMMPALGITNTDGIRNVDRLVFDELSIKRL